MHLVLFDIDGTLVDSDEFDSELFVRAVREVLGIEIGDKVHHHARYPDFGEKAVILRMLGLRV